jgi:hypothetical protein
MEDLFISYDQAEAIETLGFDEPCIATIDQTNYIHINGTKSMPRGAMMYNTINLPTKLQAIQFLLNKCDELHGGEASFEIFGDGSGNIKNYGRSFNNLSEGIDLLIRFANGKIL